jgi:hypothetical protein
MSDKEKNNLRFYFYSFCCFLTGMIWALGWPGLLIAIGAVSMLGCFGAFLLFKIKAMLDEMGMS